VVTLVDLTPSFPETGVAANDIPALKKSKTGSMKKMRAVFILFGFIVLPKFRGLFLTPKKKGERLTPQNLKKI
jgi:hypothetical protein